MLRRKGQRFLQIFLVSLVAALVSNCGTFTFRDIQKDFNNAVQAENIQNIEAIGAITSSSLLGYQDVLDRLKDEYIKSSVDPKLKMNAYAMKAVAEWRTGKLSAAKQTATTGLTLQTASSSPRDKMVLLIIRPLVNDQDLGVKYRQSGQKVAWNDYQNTYAKDFEDAVRDLREAMAQATPDLPEDVVFYVYFQRWRVLQNWRHVIYSLESQDNRTQALKGAQEALNGVEIKDEIKNQKEKIPEGHWLRRYIEYKERQ